ncbi:MAG TPA: SGNH/GDSL hydrolase family protein [Lacisediminihabitans sp.]|uniref:SGNH/GDSL hydrolase family protein n=1 Tax=Lacisediminihabitans sp. TaxID=2787631 RepID=UPI002EDB3227
MTVRSRVPFALLIALLLVLFGALSTGTAASATPSKPGQAKAATNGLPYVAMGDSFGAGYGIAPATGKPVAGCGQSGDDYPHRVAEALGLKLTDVTCAGAVTANLISTPQRTDHGTAKPQADALGRDTRVVTVTIGGNDLGFFTTATACIALSADGPIISAQKPNCKKSYVIDGKDTMAARLAGPVTSGLAKTFATITAAAPRAKVFVVGYPTIMPNAANTPAKGCFRAPLEGSSLPALHIDDGFPFTDVDVVYLNSLQQSLDQAMRAATERAGFTYVSTLEASAAHSPCASADASYINGISLRLNSADRALSVSPGALHPNAKGAAFLARSVIPEIERAFPVHTSTPRPQSLPAQDASPWRWAALAVGAVVLAIVALWVILWRRRRNRSVS